MACLGQTRNMIRELICIHANGSLSFARMCLEAELTALLLAVPRQIGPGKLYDKRAWPESVRKRHGTSLQHPIAATRPHACSCRSFSLAHISCLRLSAGNSHVITLLELLLFGDQLIETGLHSHFSLHMATHHTQALRSECSRQVLSNPRKIANCGMKRCGPSTSDQEERIVPHAPCKNS